MAVRPEDARRIAARRARAQPAARAARRGRARAAARRARSAVDASRLGRASTATRDAGRHLYLVLDGTATLAPRAAPAPAARAGRPLRRARRRWGAGTAARLVTSEARLTVARLSAAGLGRARARGARRRGAARAGARGRARRRARSRSPATWGCSSRGRSLPRAQEITVRVDRRGRGASGPAPALLRPAPGRGRRRSGGGRAARAEAGVARDPGVRGDHGRARSRCRTGRGGASTRTRSACCSSRRPTSSRPGLRVRMGPSRGTRQLVEVEGALEGTRGALAERLQARMERLAAARRPVPLRVLGDRRGACGWFARARLGRRRAAAADPPPGHRPARPPAASSTRCRWARSSPPPARCTGFRVSPDAENGGLRARRSASAIRAERPRRGGGGRAAAAPATAT